MKYDPRLVTLTIRSKEIDIWNCERDVWLDINDEKSIKVIEFFEGDDLSTKQYLLTIERVIYGYKLLTVYNKLSTDLIFILCENENTKDFLTIYDFFHFEKVVESKEFKKIVLRLSAIIYTTLIDEIDNKISELSQLRHNLVEYNV